MFSIEDFMAQLEMEAPKIDWESKTEESDYYITIDGDKAFWQEIVTAVAQHAQVIANRFEADINTIILQLATKEGQPIATLQELTNKEHPLHKYISTVYQAQIFQGSPIDKEGNALKLNYRINVYNLPQDIGIDQLEKALKEHPNTPISNIRIYNKGRTTVGHFCVNNITARDYFLRQVVNLKIDTQHCPLEESITNFLQHKTLIASNLPLTVMGHDIPGFVEAYLRANLTACKEARDKSIVLNLPLKPILKEPIPQDPTVFKYSTRLTNFKGYQGEATIQLNSQETAAWIGKWSEFLLKYNTNHLISRPGFPRPIFDRVDQYFQSITSHLASYDLFHITNTHM